MKIEELKVYTISNNSVKFLFIEFRLNLPTIVQWRKNVRIGQTKKETYQRYMD